MKDLLKTALVFAVLLTAIPMLTFIKPQGTEIQPSETAVSDGGRAENGSVPKTENETSEDILKVLDFTSGQVMEISLRDYVIGACRRRCPHPSSQKR